MKDSFAFSELIDIPYACIKRVTDKAVLVVWADGGEDWVPRSVILDGHALDDDAGSGLLEVQRWFAKEEGLI